MRISILFLSLILLSSCASMRQTRQLKSHRAEIQRIVNDASLNPEQKLDQMSMNVIEMLDQALNYLDPRKGAQLLERYSAENETDIDKIIEEFSQWQEGLDPLEKVAFGIRFVQKPYIKDLANLSVEVEKKYKQVRFVARLASKLKLI